MIPKQENNNKIKPQWLSGVREMNGFIGIRWCRLVREVDMHLIMRRLGCLHVNENRDE